MKTCTKCKLSKVETDFHSKNGKRREVCKACVSVYGKKHYHNNLEQYRKRCRETKKRAYEVNRQKIIEYLTVHPCIHCGEADIRCLDFDHLRDKRYDISRMIRSGKTWKAILREIDKCQVLCSNCHRKKTSKQLGYFKETAISTVVVR